MVPSSTLVSPLGKEAETATILRVRAGKQISRTSGNSIYSPGRPRGEKPGTEVLQSLAKGDSSKFTHGGEEEPFQSACFGAAVSWFERQGLELFAAARWRSTQIVLTDQSECGMQSAARAKKNAG